MPNSNGHGHKTGEGSAAPRYRNIAIAWLTACLLNCINATALQTKQIRRSNNAITQPSLASSTIEM
ncbi:hypothetical protein LY78DRAFT_657145, partial [Colletotrichum sublineola]